MGSIEKKIVSTILSAIRAQRQEPADRGSSLLGYSQPVIAQAKIREAVFTDFDAVTDLKRRWGLAADSRKNWERLWHHNPALMQGTERPIGWVLEANGKVVGYIGNISLLYHYGEKTLTAVTAHGLVVEPAYRGVGICLVAAFFRQKFVDLFVSTTAIEGVGRIARAFKARTPNQAEYESVFFWVLEPGSFAKALVNKLGLRSFYRLVVRGVILLAIVTDKLVRRRWPRTSSAIALTEIGIGEIGDEFEDFFTEKVHERARLFADRAPGTLRWHFEIPGDRGIVRVLRCERNRKLVGYAVIRDEPADDTGLRKSIIADLLTKDDEPVVVDALLAASYKHAKLAGSHIIEVSGFPESVRRVYTKWHPYIRKLPACPFHYKATDPTLHEALADAASWYTSPFDGDATMIRPSYEDSTRDSGEHIERSGKNRVCEVAIGQQTSIV